ncbi:MAG: NRAMP family divalent metal transporter, partial [Armatimonadota bacterium]
KMMTVLLILMLAAFAANLVLARPSGLSVLHGVAVPTIPSDVDWITIGGLVATTFSIAGAFFQSYLVKAKGWGERDLASGTMDTVLGSIMLTLIGAVIMMTAASVLHPRGIEVTSATDMVLQLERVFGASAKYIFCVGFWAAAFSSFVTNALVGGVMINDGVGLGGKLDSVPTKAFATLVLLAGMGTSVAILAGVEGSGDQIAIKAIVVGQALTLLAVPLGAIAMVAVLFDKEATKGRGLPAWAMVVLPIGAYVLLRNVEITLSKVWPKLGEILPWR